MFAPLAEAWRTLLPPSVVRLPLSLEPPVESAKKRSRKYQKKYWSDFHTHSLGLTATATMAINIFHIFKLKLTRKAQNSGQNEMAA